jgi:hypothetical protein
MEISALLSSSALLLLGAVIGFFPTLVQERQKERRARAVRWDLPLFELSKDFAATVRQFVHLANRYQRNAADAGYAQRLDDCHARLRSLSRQLLLLGNADVQANAREVENHAYWVREVGEGREDRRMSHFQGVLAKERLDLEMTRFYRNVRTQLGVREAVDVPDDPNIAGRARKAVEDFEADDA